MGATSFLDSLHDYRATARLAQLLREIVDTRRAAAEWRARTGPQPVPVRVEARHSARRAS